MPRPAVEFSSVPKLTDFVHRFVSFSRAPAFLLAIGLTATEKRAGDLFAEVLARTEGMVEVTLASAAGKETSLRYGSSGVIDGPPRQALFARQLVVALIWSIERNRRQVLSRHEQQARQEEEARRELLQRLQKISSQVPGLHRPASMRSAGSDPGHRDLGAVIVQTILGMAKHLGIQVIAEGVANAAWQIASSRLASAESGAHRSH